MLVKTINDCGVQKLYRFDNGYGASVIQNPYSYGHEDGLWELCRIKWDGDEYQLDFSTDVKGYLTEEEVNSHLLSIKAWGL